MYKTSNHNSKMHEGSVSYCDISVVLILLLYDTYHIIQFCYTILKTINFLFKFMVIWSLKFLNSHEIGEYIKIFGLKPNKMYH